MPFAATSHRSCVAISLALSLAGNVAQSQTERRSLSADRVAIYNLAGKVQVEGRSGSGSDVVVEIRRGGRDARELRIETGDVRGNDALRIVYPSTRVIYPELGRWNNTSISVRRDGTWGNTFDRGYRLRDDGERVEIRGSGSGLEAYADLRIIVPRGKSVVIHQAVGDTRVANVDADLSIDVAASTVTTEHTRGSLSLDTGSGAVSVSDAQGDLVLDTGSGGVTVTGVRGSSLKIDTGSGSIRGSDIDVDELKADVGSGGVRLARVRASRIDVDAGSGGTELELLSNIDQLNVDAGSGGVTVKLPSTLSAEVDLETGSGGINTDFAVRLTRFERRHIVGKIGEGRGRIKIESGSGQVRLLRG